MNSRNTISYYIFLTWHCWVEKWHKPKNDLNCRDPTEEIRTQRKHHSFYSGSENLWHASTVLLSITYFNQKY